MCEDSTFASELDFGELTSLCDVDPLADILSSLGFSTDPTLGPGPGVFSAFLAAGAKTLISEYNYFDIDFRSEFTATHQTRFQATETEAMRLHFFKGAVGKRRMRLKTFVGQFSDSYLGYVVIKPQKPGAIGRSLIPVAGSLGRVTLVSRLADHVRVVVPEVTQLFGVDLQALGVPFMTQDGHLLRCAHVSAWITHYAAVLRGQVPRRATADFHAAASNQPTVERAYPSGGLGSAHLSTMLSNLDLPTDVLNQNLLRRSRRMDWQDHSILRDALAKAAGTEARTTIWVRENLTANICRYLNSGIPSILVRPELGHTQVAVGYLRARDLSSVPEEWKSSLPSDNTHSEVVAFIIADDLSGPFEVVSVNQIIAEVQDRGPRVTSVVVPLPRGVWLPGRAAEIVASVIFRKTVEARLNGFAEWRQLHQGKSADEALRKLEELSEGLFDAELDSTRDRESKYAIRSYISVGTDFKVNFDRRIQDARTSRSLSMTQLPKYVWVSEIIDRRLRTTRTPAVVATIVLDASSPNTDSAERIAATADTISPLFLHLPGMSLAIDPYFDGEEYDLLDHRSWAPAAATRYVSGRFGPSLSHLTLPKRIAAHAKTASPGR